MIGLKDKQTSVNSETEIVSLLKQYQSIYESYINDTNIYEILTAKNKKRKMDLLSRADVLYHIACVSLKAGYVRRSIKFFSAFQVICQNLWQRK